MSTLVADAPSHAAQVPFALRIPSPKMLTQKEELVMAREGHARNPGSRAVFFSLASLLTRLDYFDEAVALLQARPFDDQQWRFLLTFALMSRETEAANLEMKALMESAVAASTMPKERAAALGLLGKVYTRLGDTGRAKETLAEALALDPGEKDAFKRLFNLLLPEDAEAALLLAEKSIAAGVLHARVLGSRTLALLKLGRLEEAREAEGFQALAIRSNPGCPEGWPNLEAFHEALVEEALQHPDMRYDRYGSASARTWRLDEPTLHRTRLFPQLQKMVQREVEARVANLPDTGHPWTRAVPAKAKLRNWCVITEGDGYENWHVHQNGWMSGVYYIHVPDHIANGTGPGGCIAFGMPESVVGEAAAAAFGESLVRPYTGLMMLFPSHVYHRTYPHGGAGRRVCFAFDIVPVDGEA